MNKKQKLQQLFQNGKNEGDFLFRPILMHFAAHHIGRSYREFASDHKVLAEANLKCLEDFDIDATGLISDPYRETSAFGAKITFPEEGVPQCLKVLLQTSDDVKALKNPDVYKSERTLDRIKAAQLLEKEVGKEVPIIGWVEGPLAEACDLAGVNEVLVKLMIEPDFVKMLIDKTIVTAKDFAKAQVEAGCDLIGIGDAICSQISKEDYQEFVKDKHRELIEFIHSLGARVKLHICGNITHLLTDIRQVGPDIVDVDSLVDMDEAYRLLGNEIVRCGNLNPVSIIQQKNAEEIREEVRLLCKKEKERRFILSGGCEITVQTPSENLKAMREASRLPIEGPFAT
jgi:MtaA/CmuA family methyltransferase